MKWMPDRKIWAGGLGAVVAWVLVVVAQKYGLPLDMTTATTIVVSVGGMLSYLVPPSERDIVKRLNDTLVKMAVDDPNIPVTGKPLDLNVPK